MFEESAKKLLRDLYIKGEITETLLDDYFLSKDVNDIVNEMQWNYIYDNVSNWEVVRISQEVMAQVLGSDWKQKYEYKEIGKYKNKYSLWIKTTDEEYEKICEETKEKYAEVGIELF